jgi:hypothetical protein
MYSISQPQPQPQPPILSFYYSCIQLFMYSFVFNYSCILLYSIIHVFFCILLFIHLPQHPQHQIRLKPPLQQKLPCFGPT